MWLLRAFILGAVFSCVSAQALQQTPISITKPESKTVLINCHVLAPDFASAFIHWYRKRLNAAPERIAYMSSRLFLENSSDDGKFSIEKDLSKSVCTLTVSKVTPQDAATYYCASWDADVKIFGSGTKLIVSDKGYTAPTNFEILSSENENKLTYVCLVEKFYPEVIRVTWTEEENKEVTANVVNGEVWKSAEDDQYSIGSWLTVPKENKTKKYSCKYEHESKEDSLATTSTQDLTKTVEEQDCSTYSGNSTTIFYGDHLMHRTAYLVYIVLLLKSSMYYIIVLFFIYRMRTPAKHHGKKT
ncbi:T-cell receptor gamma alternate reading frame protein isoform X5 [Struthio camelus]|uniref:T-cell receptor gamma alternate reading frame protein isoform X5 n=1 Tax=Struthio camelus TaxID=8801 RepID=UPI003603DB3A